MANENREIVVDLADRDRTHTLIIYLERAKRLVELILDTGAMITTLAADLLKPETKLTTKQLVIPGVAGPEHTFVTHGTVITYILMNDGTKIPMELHVTDRKNAGSRDGFLGHDFLKHYKCRIDMHENKLSIKLPENTTNEKREEEKEKDEPMITKCDLADCQQCKMNFDEFKRRMQSNKMNVRIIDEMKKRGYMLLENAEIIPNNTKNL